MSTSVGTLSAILSLKNEPFLRKMREASQEVSRFGYTNKKMAPEFRRAMEIFQSTRTPMERYRQQVAVLDRQFKAGRISADTYSRAIRQVSAQHGVGVAKLGAFGGALGGVVGQLKAYAGAMIGIAGVYAVGRAIKSFGDFEKGIAAVHTMLRGGDEKYLPQYRRAIESLAVKYGQSTQTLSKGLYDVLSATIPAGQALEVLEVATRGAIGGFTDTAISASLLLTALKAYKIDASKATQVSDALFTAVWRGRMNYEMLAQGFGNVASMAAVLGVSLQETLAAISVITRAGVETDTAIMSLTNILNAIVDPSSEAQAVFKELGIEMNAETLAAEGLYRTLQKVAGLPSDLVFKLFPSMRAKKGVLPALQNMAGYYEDIAFQANNAGAETEAFNKMNDTVAQDLAVSGQAWKEFGKNIGEALAFIPRGAAELTKFDPEGLEKRGMGTLYAKLGRGAKGELPGAAPPPELVPPSPAPLAIPPPAAPTDAEKAIEKSLDAMSREYEVYGMTTRQIAMYDMALRGATDSELQQARALNEAMAGMEEYARLQSAAEGIFRGLNTPIDSLAESVETLRQAFIEGAISRDDFMYGWSKLSDNAVKSITGITSETDRFQEQFDQLNDAFARNLITVSQYQTGLAGLESRVADRGATGPASFEQISRRYTVMPGEGQAVAAKGAKRGADEEAPKQTALLAAIRDKLAGGVVARAA